jgi:ribonuclease D
MPDAKLQAPTLIDNQAALGELTEKLKEKRVIALDTESDSLFSYYPKVCLIQLSAFENGDGSAIRDYLVDPLAIESITPLTDLLSQPSYEIVMHAADNDLLVLQRDFGIAVERLFDTQLAARILGKDKVGLAAILDEEFGVTSNKRMQRTDWGNRPLQPEQIAYAQMDTHYLLPLREKYSAELQSAGRWQEAQEAFSQLVVTEFEGREPSDRTMWQMKETRMLPEEYLGVLEALWQWRENEAQRRDIPPFKVMGNKALAELAENQPATKRELANTPHIGRATVHRYGSQLLEMIRDGQRRPLPEPPESARPPDYRLDRKIMARYDALRKWRTKTAEQRGVAPEIVMANATLLEVAKRSPQNLKELQKIRDIGPWKAETYGAAMLEIVKK